MSDFDGYVNVSTHGITYNHPGCKDCMSLFAPISTLKEMIEGMRESEDPTIHDNDPISIERAQERNQTLSDILTAITNLQKESE